MKHSIILLSLLVATSVARSQARHLTLSEAIELSLQNNKNLRISQLNKERADYDLKDARGRRLPDVSISGAYLRVLQPNIDLKVKTNNSSGGTDQQSTTPTVDQAAYTIANVSLPLFTGFRIQSGIESAQYLQRAAELDADRSKEDVVQNTIAAYINYYKAIEAANLVDENLTSAKQRVTDFSNLEQNGLLARNDLLKAQLQQSNIELTLLDALSNVHMANLNMNLMLGLPQETVIEPDTSFLNVTTEPMTLTDWEQVAINNRKDLQSLSYRKQAAVQGIRAAKGAYYPSLALTGGYIAAYVPNFITITNAVNAGIGLSYSPSSLWKASSGVRQAKERVQEIQINEEILWDAVRLQINQAYEKYELSRQSITVYAKAVEQARENYRIVKNKYDNSLATATELLDADVAQLQASLNYENSKADAVVSWYNLVHAAGLSNNNSTH